MQKNIDKNKITDKKQKSFIEEYFDPKELKILLFIVFIGFLLRLIYIMETSGTPFFVNLYSDSKIYYDWAKSIVNSGDWIGDEAFYMSPVYPYFLAVIYAFTKNAIETTRIIQVIISSFNIILIYLIARNLFSKNAGYFAAGISAVYSVFIFYSGAILSETLQAFVVSALVFALTLNLKTNIVKKWFLIGLLLGISIIFRANLLLFFIAVLVWIFFEFRKEPEYKSIITKTVLYFTIGVALPLMLVSARNYFVSGDFILVTSNGGINFYIGNNENATGVYKLPEDFDITTDLSGEHYAEQITGNELSPAEASSYWFERGIDFAVEHPVKEIKLIVKKFFLFFDDSENPQSAVMDIKFFANNYSTLLSLPLPNFYFVMVLFLAGILLSFNYRKKLSLIYLFIASYILSTILFFVIGRFRVALTPLLIVFAGFAIVKNYELIKAKEISKIFVPVIIIVLFVVTQNYATPDYNFSSYDAYLNLGESKFAEGKYDEALKNYEQSLKLRDYYATYLSIGNALAAKNDLKGAFNAYRTALEKKPDYAKAHFAIGTLFIRRNQLDAALEAFRQTIKLDPSIADAYRNIAIIHYINENYKESLLNFEKYLQLSDDENAKKSVRQDVEELKKRLSSEE